MAASGASPSPRPSCCLLQGGVYQMTALVRLRALALEQQVHRPAHKPGSSRGCKCSMCEKHRHWSCTRCLERGKGVAHCCGKGRST